MLTVEVRKDNLQSMHIHCALLGGKLLVERERAGDESGVRLGEGRHVQLMFLVKGCKADVVDGCKAISLHDLAVLGGWVGRQERGSGLAKGGLHPGVLGSGVVTPRGWCWCW